MEYFKSATSFFDSDSATKKVAIVSGISVATACCWYCVKWSRQYDRNKRLHEAIQKRQQERTDQLRNITEKLNVFDQQQTTQRKEILALSFAELTEALQKETYSAVQVLHAYQEYALVAQAKTNCVTQFFLEAEDIARQLDQSYAGKTKPALFGIPFSVKESISVKGHDSTLGYSASIGHPHKEDAACVAALRAQGAIPFVHTNVPQTLLSYSCSNPIYGLTGNPFNKERTPGGSTGGEGALIALRGSPFGLGTDVGGSIRIPSHFCGIAGLKPTNSRISQLRLITSTPGRPVIRGTIGPMAPNVDTLIAICRQLFSDAIYAIDQQVVPMAFNENILEDDKPLTIGWYDTDGYFDPTPACRRAVREAKQVLERHGHRLVQWTPPDATKAYELAIGALSMDGGKYMMDKLSRDIIDEVLAPHVWAWRWPVWLKRCLAHFVPARAAGVLRAQASNIPELRHLYERVDLYKAQFAQSMREAGLDGILCPAFTTPAVSHSHPGQVSGNICYTVLFNILDYPAGIVKVTHVTAADELTTANEYPESDEWYVKVKRENTQGSVGLPVGAQIAAPPFREETVLRIMKDLEQGLMQK